MGPDDIGDAVDVEGSAEIVVTEIDSDPVLDEGCSVRVCLVREVLETDVAAGGDAIGVDKLRGNKKVSEPKEALVTGRMPDELRPGSVDMPVVDEAEAEAGFGVDMEPTNSEAASEVMLRGKPVDPCKLVAEVLLDGSGAGGRSDVDSIGVPALVKPEGRPADDSADPEVMEPE